MRAAAKSADPGARRLCTGVRASDLGRSETRPGRRARGERAAPATQAPPRNLPATGLGRDEGCSGGVRARAEPGVRAAAKPVARSTKAARGRVRAVASAAPRGTPAARRGPNRKHPSRRPLRGTSRPQERDAAEARQASGCVPGRVRGQWQPSDPVGPPPSTRPNSADRHPHVPEPRQLPVLPPPIAPTGRSASLPAPTLRRITGNATAERLVRRPPQLPACAPHRCSRCPPPTRPPPEAPSPAPAGSPPRPASTGHGGEGSVGP